MKEISKSRPIKLAIPIPRYSPKDVDVCICPSF
jgi:hypothetical protein